MSGSTAAREQQRICVKPEGGGRKCQTAYGQCPSDFSVCDFDSLPDPGTVACEDRLNSRRCIKKKRKGLCHTHRNPKKVKKTRKKCQKTCGLCGFGAG